MSSVASELLRWADPSFSNRSDTSAVFTDMRHFLIDFDINSMTSSAMIYYVTSSPKVALLLKLYVNEKRTRKLLRSNEVQEISKILGITKLRPLIRIYSDQNLCECSAE